MKRNTGFIQRRRAQLKVTLSFALLALAACGSRSDYHETADTFEAGTPAPTTTYVSAETAKVRAWWDSLTDLQRLAACDTYGVYALQGGEQAFVDWAMAQGATELQAWTLAGVLGENCVERM